MKFLDTILGRSRAVPAKLDALFALPSAAVTLETEAGLASSGTAAVCFKPASGQAFETVRADLEELLKLDASQSGTTLSDQDDSFGYHWIILSAPDIGDLVSRVHIVNSTLEERGFGPQLLCSVFGFGEASKRLYLVYLYKRGTFYPFAPRDSDRRDNEEELRIRGIVSGDLAIEDDLTRWFPVWGVPG